MRHPERLPILDLAEPKARLRSRLSGERRRPDLAVNPDQAKRLSGLIDDFLDLQSIEQDRFVLTLEPLALSAWARTIAGSPDTQVPGVLLGREPLPAPLVSTVELSARDRVESFRLTASPLARKLAGLLGLGLLLNWLRLRETGWQGRGNVLLFGFLTALAGLLAPQLAAVKAQIDKLAKS